MRQINLTFLNHVNDLGGLQLTLLKDGKQFLVTPPPRVRAARSGDRPRLYCGQKAAHLSIPLRDDPRGRYPGKLWVHLTYGDGHHEEVAVLDPGKLAGVFKILGDALFERYREETFRVTPEELADKELEILLPRPSMAEMFKEILTKPRRHYKVASSDWEKLLKHAVRSTPLALHQQWVQDLGRPIPVFHPSHGTPLMVSRLPGWFDDGPAGWFGTPSPLFTDAELDEVLRRVVPPEFWAKFALVTRELGLGSIREPMATWARRAEAS